MSRAVLVRPGVHISPDCGPEVLVGGDTHAPGLSIAGRMFVFRAM